MKEQASYFLKTIFFIFFLQWERVIKHSASVVSLGI